MKQNRISSPLQIFFNVLKTKGVNYTAKEKQFNTDDDMYFTHDLTQKYEKNDFYMENVKNIIITYNLYDKVKYENLKEVSQIIHNFHYEKDLIHLQNNENELLNWIWKITIR